MSPERKGNSYSDFTLPPDIRELFLSERYDPFSKFREEHKTPEDELNEGVKDAIGIFLPEGAQSLPSVCREEITGILMLHNNLIMRTYHNLYVDDIPIEELDNSLLPIQKCGQDFFGALLPFKLQNRSWEATFSRLGQEVSPIIKSRVRAEVLGLICKNVQQNVDYLVKTDHHKPRGLTVKIGDVGVYLAGAEFNVELTKYALAWAVVKDQPGFEKNPVLPLLKLDFMGVTLKGFRRVGFPRRQEVLGAHLGVGIGGSRYLACFDLKPEMQAITPEHLRFHSPFDDCQRARPLKK